MSSSEILCPNGEVLVSRHDGTVGPFVVLVAAIRVMITSEETSPMLADERKEAMLKRVPRACPRWDVADQDRETCFIGQMLQFPLPQPDA
jgi:hypothetical protein